MQRTFGRQRSRAEIGAAILLLVGFTALAYAMWIARGAWFGVLLPIAYLVGIFSGFRSEVREIDLDDETLTIRTFFRAYPIPRAHITNVAATRRGVAIDVLNGARYFITPPGVDPEEMFGAVSRWHAGAGESAD